MSNDQLSHHPGFMSVGGTSLTPLVYHARPARGTDLGGSSRQAPQLITPPDTDRKLQADYVLKLPDEWCYCGEGWSVGTSH